jgi:U4/U6.U5 tri-snRNP-associated protein 1
VCRRKENREKRRREAELRSTTTLGAAGDDVDDLAAWAAKIKPKSAADAAADGAADAAAGARPSKRRKGAKAAAGSEDEDEEGGHTAADLQGVKVRHDLENLTEGEAVVLTLADTGRRATAGV